MALGLQAFYVLFADQVTSPDWPTKVCQNAGRGPQGGEYEFVTTAKSSFELVGTLRPDKDEGVGVSWFGCVSSLDSFS